MKNIIRYFIKYPVAVNIFIIAVILFGIIGAMKLKSSFFPLVPDRIISIQLTYPGASPQEIEEGIVQKIEQNLKGVTGIDRVTSVSRENTATILVETTFDSNIDVVLQDVKNAVDRVPSFPAEMEPPIIAKQVFQRPTIDLIISGEGVSLRELKDEARKIESDLLAMDGISQIKLSGFPAEEIEIAVRENDLLSYRLSFREVAAAVQKYNLLMTGGMIKTNRDSYLIRAAHRGYYAGDLENLVVRSLPSGAAIRLKDIAAVRDKWEENPDRIRFNGEKAVSISIRNTNTEDLIGTAEKVKKYLADFNERHRNVHLDIAQDMSIPLKQRTRLLLKNGALGVVLVLLMLSLFLNARLGIWVAAGIPISFLGMLIFLHTAGITINVLSLFGMIIVIGILVDDGIVIGENIYHHYHDKGKSRIRAAVDGTVEVIPPVFSSIITTLLAFSAFYFIDGRMGDFFSEVSTVVTLTLSVSLIEAAIILPAHIVHSKSLMRDDEKEKNTVLRWLNLLNRTAGKALAWVRDRLYVPYLEYFLHNRFLGIVIPLSLFILSFGALKAGIVKAAFFPSVASDKIEVKLQLPQGTNERITDSLLVSMEQKAQRVNEYFTKKQNNGKQVIQNYIIHLGPGTSQGSLLLNLLPGDQRDFPADIITAALRDSVGEIPMAENLSFGSGTHMGGMPINISLMSYDIDELKNAVVMLKSRLHRMPQLKDITDNDPEGIKEIRLRLKPTAVPLGLDLRTLMTQVRSAFFGYQAQRFQRGQDEIKVWVRYDRKNRMNPGQLKQMRIITPSGKRVPLSEVADFSIQRGDIAINHLNGIREISVEADLRSRKDSPTELLDSIKTNIIPEIRKKYPGIRASFEGQNREMKKVKKSMPLVLVPIMLLMYMIIAFTFRSYGQPIILLFLIPFSMIGVIWGHYLHGFKINILSWLGIVALIGIMVNDGLVLITKFNNYLREGLRFDDALIQAGRSRFRAIFLTSITTVAGMMPLLSEKSMQAHFLKPMAIAISYGIIISTFLTLLFLPLLLSVWNSVRVTAKRLWTGKEVSREEVERVIIEMKEDEFIEK